MHSQTIGVFPPEAFPRYQRMLEVLGDLFMVSFMEGAAPGLSRENYHAVLCFGDASESMPKMGDSSLPCLNYVGGQSQSATPVPSEVMFGESLQLHRCFRGRRLPDSSLSTVCTLEREPGDEVMARTGGHVIWIYRSQNGVPLHLVAVDLPPLADGEYLFQHFSKTGWARLLPLMHFLRELSGWEYPPIRASFMFDDPNLHWNSYGYVNYAPLARHAHAHNYHASFATVPLDGWYAHPATASLFRQNQSRLSLLIHGNNHTASELAQTYSDTSRQALVAQALHRIERLEKMSALTIPRVMAAPHGACNHDMASALVRAGFEAACISRGSIMAHNRDTAWPATVGLNLAEFLGSGLPVIPRLRMSRDSVFEILIAAFLGQPIIPIGHHEDLAGGLDLLGELAELINSIGDVQWLDMRSIARSNFCTRRQGEVLHVKMYSRKIRLSVPAGVTHVSLHRPWLESGEWEGLALRSTQVEVVRFDAYQEKPIPIVPGTEIEITSINPGAVDFRIIPHARTSLWAIARRQLCELRDRLKPLSDRFTKNRRHGF